MLVNKVNTGNGKNNGLAERRPISYDGMNNIQEVVKVLIIYGEQLASIKEEVTQLNENTLKLIENTSETSQLIVDSAVTNFIGKKKVFIEDRLTQLERESMSVLRARVLKYVRMLGGLKGSNIGKAWGMAYNVLLNATGFDVYKYGKTSLKTGNKEYGPSYLNTVIQKRYLAHLVLVLEELVS